VSGASTRAVTGIAGARRVVQLYPPAHPAYAQALSELEGAVRAAAAEQPLILNLHQGRLYEGSTVFPDDVPGIGQVVEILESLGLESVTFLPTFSGHDAVALTEILALRPSPELDVRTELEARGVDSVAVSVLARDGNAVAMDPARMESRGLLRTSETTAREVLQKVLAGDPSAAEKAQALSLSLAARLQTEMPLIVALATARQPQEPDVSHALNVMVYSLLLGSKLSLPEDGLASLGSAALLHDVGKLGFDSSDPTQAERARTEHPAIGAEMLQRLAFVDPAPMLVAYEHHMHADGSGFPARDDSYVTHPFSRMVAVADHFDALINPGPKSTALTPDRALVQVLRLARSKLDPFFARLFAGALGPFPIGCVVRLCDQSVGVVICPGALPLMPTVRLVYDALGLEVKDDAEDIDLEGSDLEIVEVLEPRSLHIEVADRLL
jgi:hypothetical protein